MEIEKDTCLPFLDVKLELDNDTLSYGVYRKKKHTPSDISTLVYITIHDKKRSVITIILRRADNACGIKSKLQEIQHVKRILQKNGYAVKYIQTAPIP